jgi:drug/metabolite transporter (DMT)-like permease
MIQLWFMLAMAFAALLGAIGQISLKKLSDVPLGAMLFSWYTWLFIGTYGAAVLINLAAYRYGGKVSILYPVIATSYIWAAILAWKYLGESISGWTIAGIGAILIGVTLIGIGVGVAG